MNIDKLKYRREHLKEKQKDLSKYMAQEEKEALTVLLKSELQGVIAEIEFLEKKIIEHQQEADN